MLDDFHGAGDVEDERHRDLIANVMQRHPFTISTDESDQGALIAISSWNRLATFTLLDRLHATKNASDIAAQKLPQAYWVRKCGFEHID